MYRQEGRAVVEPAPFDPGRRRGTDENLHLAHPKLQNSSRFLMSKSNG